MSKKSYADALEVARKAYCLKDRAEAAEKAGATFDEVRAVTIFPMMGITFLVHADGDTIERAEDRSEARPVEKILLLHYLATASGVAMSDRFVAFREVPGCTFYNTTFHAHTVMALIRAFGNEDGSLREACETLGGKRAPGSGLSMVLPALPRVPVTLSYWPGEEEMPPGAQLLFDASVVRYLPAEDIAVIGETLVHRVLETAGKGGEAALYQYEA